MDYFFPDETIAADSPRLAWLKKHDIRTKRLAAGGIGRLQWQAHVAGTEMISFGATEDEAIAGIATTCGLKLWNEEGS